MLPAYFCGQSLRYLRNAGVFFIFYNLNDDLTPNYEHIKQILQVQKPDIFLHLAAFTDNRKLENDPERTINDNIIGTSNVTLACIKENLRLIYISTDYVYSGKKGLYKENDEILPVNKYAWSKLGGECAVTQHTNHLIIRTSIGSLIFPYDEAFVDMWTSKDTVNVIAPLILKATKSNLNGIINIGTKRKNMFEYANKLNSDVKKATRNEFGDETVFDTSFDNSKFTSFLNNDK